MTDRDILQTDGQTEPQLATAHSDKVRRVLKSNLVKTENAKIFI